MKDELKKLLTNRKNKKNWGISEKIACQGWNIHVLTKNLAMG